MPIFFHKPENALNRAKEFVEVGKSESALEVLNDVIRSKKHRQWSETHESIMRLYLTLCVDLQRSSVAKDGLYQYRNICKDSNLNSFQKVVDWFLDLADSKAAAAKEESQQLVLDVEDLDVVQTPESLLLSTVSGEDTQDRTDRVKLMPWVRFLWESHRQILELLKNNYLLEKVYAEVAKRAFKFCLDYRRRTEFRKLCDILRNHLQHSKDRQSQQYALKLDNQDTIQCLVDIRFEQLDKSISIDLWQEAFKAIEEIHNLITISKHKAKSSLLENFYQKQASVYWMANNKLFHAAALQRLFILRKEHKKTFSLDSEEARKTASLVLLATLAIPIQPTHSERQVSIQLDYTKQEKMRRLSSLLKLSTPPTRASLIKDLARHGVMQCITPELQEIYQLLEVEFIPLQLSSRLKVLLDKLEESKELNQYVESLKEVMLVRLIKQISQVYQSIELSRLAELALFASPTELERVVVNTAKTSGIQIRIDHQTDSLWFGTDISFDHCQDMEGPVVQGMPSEVVCTHLSLMAHALEQAARIVFRKENEAEQLKTCHESCKVFLQHEQSDYRAILKRKKAIEERKEYIENIRRKKDEVERLEKVEKEKEWRQAKQKLLEKDMKERKEEKERMEIAQMKMKIAEDKLKDLKKTPLGARAFADIKPEDLENLDPNDIMVKKLQQMEKERREKETKYKTQEKRIDHMERAKREVELPLLEQYYQQQKEKDRQLHEKREEERVAKAIAERREQEVVKARLDKMSEGREEFVEFIMQKRRAEYQEKVEKFELALAEKRKERLNHRRKERKIRRKEEAAEIARDEKKRKEKEEQEAMLRKLDEQRRLQEERERIAEEKIRQKEKEIQQKLEAEKEQRAREVAEEEGEWRRQTPRDQGRYVPPVRRTEESSGRSPQAYRPPVPKDENLLQDRDRDWGRRREPSPRGRPWRDQDDREGGRRFDDYDSRRSDDRSWRRGGDSEQDQRYRPPREREPDSFRSWESPRDRDSDFYRHRERDPDSYRPRDRDSDSYRPRDRDLDSYRPRDRDPDGYRPRDKDLDSYRPRDRDPDSYRPRDKDPDSYRSRDRDFDSYRSPRDRDFDSYRSPRDRDFDSYRSPRARESDYHRSRDRDQEPYYPRGRDVDSFRSRDRDLDRGDYRRDRGEPFGRLDPGRGGESWRRSSPDRGRESNWRSERRGDDCGPPRKRSPARPDEDGWEEVRHR